MICLLDREAYASTPDASLTDTYWKLVEIGGQPASLGADEKELSMVLASEGNIEPRLLGRGF